MREVEFSSPLAVLCTAVARRVFHASVRIWLDNCHSGTLTARRTIDCERNIVSIVVLPLPFGCSFVRGKNCFAEYTILVLYNSTQKKYQFFRKTYHTLLFVHARVRKICTFHIFLLILHGFSAFVKGKTFVQS